MVYSGTVVMPEIYNKDEYGKIIHEYRSRFLDLTTTLDIQLTTVICSYFLRKEKEDFPLFLETVFDDEKWAVFGQKIMWLGKILKHRFPDYDKRKEIICTLDNIRGLRNEFAHTFSLEPTEKDAQNKIVRLYDLENGEIIPREIPFDQISKTTDSITDAMKSLEDIHQLIKKDRLER